MTKISRITQDIVRKLINYDPATGEMIWNIRVPEMFAEGKKSATHQCNVWNAKYAGNHVHCSVVGRRPTFSLLGEKYPLSHVAWLHFHGVAPKFVIDHIDGNPRNNQISNLRDVASALNSMNCRIPLSNTSGMAGVYLDRKTGNWYARVQWKRKIIRLGTFATIEEAKAARQAALIMAGFSARHGISLEPRLTN